MSLTAIRGRNRKGFSMSENLPSWHPRWNAEYAQDLKTHLAGKFMADVSSRLSPVHKDYRKKKAKLLLSKIKRGELSPQSEAAVRRDYKKEFEKLESKA